MLNKKRIRTIAFMLLITMIMLAIPMNVMAATIEAVTDAFTVSEEELAQIKVDMNAILMKYLGVTNMSKSDIEQVVSQLSDHVRDEAIDEAFTFYDRVLQCRD